MATIRYLAFISERPEELAKFKQAVAPVIDKFVANMDKLGLQGRKIVDTFASAQPK